ncbi:hypothetical protein [Haloferax sp. ATB1]|uniref:hypothetical protein n=1 Tax=Haloferax sp. ATB1 TaxID=1508454 RepID=UPI000FE14476|nr:hypothetical protein [Haloferax sp. ATB1]
MLIADRVLEEGEDLVAEMEVEYRRQFGTESLGSVLVSDQRIIFLYQSEGSLNRFADHQLSAEPFAQYRHGELDSVFIPEPDMERVSQLKSDFIAEVESETGASYFMDVLEEANRDPPVNPRNCTCDGISSNKVLVEDENMGLAEYFDENEFRFVSCKDCFQIYGRYRRGKKASLNKLFSADWLLGGDLSAESIVELGEDDAYAIHHTPSVSTRVQDAVLTQSHIADRSDAVVSTYKHEYQHSLCYILGDELAGYLTWEEHEMGPILSQLYVREEHRGRASPPLLCRLVRACVRDRPVLRRRVDPRRESGSRLGWPP